MSQHSHDRFGIEQTWLKISRAYDKSWMDCGVMISETIMEASKALDSLHNPNSPDDSMALKGVREFLKIRRADGDKHAIWLDGYIDLLIRQAHQAAIDMRRMNDELDNPESASWTTLFGAFDKLEGEVELHGVPELNKRIGNYCPENMSTEDDLHGLRDIYNDPRELAETIRRVCIRARRVSIGFPMYN